LAAELSELSGGLALADWLLLLGGGLLFAAALGGGGAGGGGGGCCAGGSRFDGSFGRLLSTIEAKLLASCDASGMAGFGGAFWYDALAVTSDVTLRTCRPLGMKLQPKVSKERASSIDRKYHVFSKHYVLVP
jgi:hypothetical protein